MCSMTIYILKSFELMTQVDFFRKKYGKKLMSRFSKRSFPSDSHVDFLRISRSTQAEVPWRHLVSQPTKLTVKTLQLELRLRPQ